MASTLPVDDTIALPPLVRKLLASFAETHEIELGDPDRSTELEPFLFTERYDLEGVPRDLDALFASFTSKGTKLLFNIITENSTGDNGAYAGLTIFLHPKALALYELHWSCPEYCDDECDASCSLTIHWALQKAFYTAHIPPYVQAKYLQIIEELMAPLEQLCPLVAASIPLNGELVGTSLRTLFEKRLKSTVSAPFLTALQRVLTPTPPPSSR